jgi:hypothetical protein
MVYPLKENRVSKNSGAEGLTFKRLGGQGERNLSLLALLPIALGRSRLGTHPHLMPPNGGKRRRQSAASTSIRARSLANVERVDVLMEIRGPDQTHRTFQGKK